MLSSVQKFWPRDLQEGKCNRAQQQQQQQQHQLKLKLQNVYTRICATQSRWIIINTVMNTYRFIGAYFLALMFAAFNLRSVVCDLAPLGSHIQPTFGTSKSLSTTVPSELVRLLAQAHCLAFGTGRCQPVGAAAAAALLQCSMFACMTPAYQKMSFTFDKRYYSGLDWVWTL
jgi:hypothetical protein